MMKGVASGNNFKTQSQKIRNLQTMAKVLYFIQNNGITDIEQLANKVEETHRQFYDVSNKIKSTNRRLDTLTQHLAQYEIYKQHKALYKKYKDLPQKKADEFYDKHGENIRLYENVRDYLKSVLNGRTEVPVKKWEKEVLDLTAVRFALCDKFYRLKDEVKNAETLRRGAEKIMKDNEREIAPQRARAQGIEI